MNRNHLIIILAILFSPAIVTAIILSTQATRYKAEVDDINYMVETSIYAASLELKDAQTNRRQITMAVHEYFHMLSLISGKEVNELYAYSPVFAVLQNEGFYICSYTDKYTISDNAVLHPYTDGTQIITLDGYIKSGNHITSVKVSNEVIMQCVQLSVQDAMNTALQEYQNSLKRYEFIMNLTSDITISPNPSIVTVFQNYPLSIQNKSYNYVHQSAGQIHKK